MMEVLEKAFDELVMTDQEWDELRQAIMMQMQGAMQPQPAAGEQPPAGGGKKEGGKAGGNADAAQVAEEEAVRRGVPRDVARQGIAQRLNQGS
jgi:hypothetical protein